MAMGTRKGRERQSDLWIARSAIVETPGNAFYDRLNKILSEHKFDARGEALCRKFYKKSPYGRPSLAPGVYFRALLIGYFEGLDSERGIACRAADSLSLRGFLGNSCHTLNPAAEFVAGANPYLLGQQQPAKLNPGVYLGGGNDFGTLDPDGRSAHIISRNLTPDKTGRPEGGATFEEFLDHIRNGNDTDHWQHPTCMDNKLGPNCVPFPFNGEKLQIMPWPTYAKMTHHDLRAIYEYLRAIPCLEGDPGNPDGANTQGHRCK